MLPTKKKKKKDCIRALAMLKGELVLMCLCTFVLCVPSSKLSLAPQKHQVLPCQLWGLRSWVRQKQERPPR